MKAIVCKLGIVVAGVVMLSVTPAHSAEPTSEVVDNAESTTFKALENLARVGTGEPACLQTAPDNKVVLGDCKVQPDDVRRRQWRFVRSGLYVMVQNQYNLEVGHPACLKWEANGNPVVLGQCTTEDKPFLRSLWSWDGSKMTRNAAGLTTCIMAVNGKDVPWADFCTSDSAVMWSYK